MDRQTKIALGIVTTALALQIWDTEKLRRKHNQLCCEMHNFKQSLIQAAVDVKFAEIIEDLDIP